MVALVRKSLDSVFAVFLQWLVMSQVMHDFSVVGAVLILCSILTSGGRSITKKTGPHSDLVNAMCCLNYDGKNAKGGKDVEAGKSKEDKVSESSGMETNSSSEADQEKKHCKE